MEPHDESRSGQVSVRWALTPGGWMRADTLTGAPAVAAGYARVDLSPSQTRMARVQAVVLDMETEDAAALLEKYGPPPREDVPDEVVREATASACRVVGPRHGNPAGWDRLRDLRILALAQHMPR